MFEAWNESCSAPLTIAIDGPAGAGKSTVAKALAKRLNIMYLDTGAMYRSLAWLALERKVALDDATALVALMRDVNLKVVATAEGTRIFNGSEDITTKLYSAETGRNASLVAYHPQVRKRMVAWQQELASQQAAILDGRDIGTTVLPRADLKIFLTATPEERAARRYMELRHNGATLEQVAHDLAVRDERDSKRATAPLRPAADAICIDSSGRDVAEIIEQIMGLLRQRGVWKEGVSDL